MAFGENMTRKEKKSLGLLPRQVFARTRELCRSGDIDRSMSRREAAVVVAMESASEEASHDAWQAVEYGSVDWDALLAFIEKLLAILLPLFLPPA